MTLDDANRVSHIYHEALRRPPGERAAFVRNACDGDEPLRLEIESLLAYESAANGFLEGGNGRDGSSAETIIGRNVGHYSITASLGKGGMGEVYRARDNKLGREVAIKILPSHFCSDPERRARFTREARFLASLNHPNIGAIYGLEEQGDLTALVLELVEGSTLASRLEAGPLKVSEALAIARQIAEALDAAHQQGIVHRDLKPANVVIQPAGLSSAARAKVLDFGVAKMAIAFEKQSGGTGSISTIEGRVLGTPAYMSPEQARGETIDKRTDIWAFGCVLYEMLSARRAFQGETLSDTFVSVLEREPDWTVLASGTPDSIRTLIQRCLRKDLHRRLHDVADALIEIDDAIANDGTAPVRDRQPRRFTRYVPLALGLALAGLASGWLVSRLSSREPPRPPIQTLISVAPADELRASNLEIESLGEGRPNRTCMALSPDGRTLVFSARSGNHQQLYARTLDQLDAKPIAGTEGGGTPFFSQDGLWVGFYANDELKKVTLAGAAGPTTIVPAKPPIYGASWGSNNTIVFSRDGLWQVPVAGGTPRQLSKLDPSRGEVSHRLPHVLPGGGAVLFTVTQSGFPAWEETEIDVLSLATGERKTLLRGSDARYVPSGHIVYMRAGALLAVPFDVDRLEVTGAPVSMIPAVMQAAYIPNVNNDSGAGQFTVSPSGTLVYVPGGMFPDLERSLVWIDRTGVFRPAPIPPGAYFAPRLSPDGRTILLWTSGRDRNLWLYDIPRGIVTRLTTEGRNSYGQWTRDGSHVTFQKEGILLWKRADGTGPTERLGGGDVTGLPVSWSPTGELAIIRHQLTTDYDIWTLPPGGDRKPQVFLQTKAKERYPDFSPDGQWLAYSSNESGRDEIYVEPFPGPGERHQVSVGGGIAPVWARDSHELFYQVRKPGKAEGREMRSFMAVSIDVRGGFRASIPKALFEHSYPKTDLPIREYDVTSDGRRFLVLHEDRPPIKVTEMVLVQNWLDELKRRVPPK